MEASLVASNDTITSFYEVEMDGVIRKEEKYDYSDSESEIIIDSSGSIDMRIIKIVLRECKNILSLSKIKVGFCDTEFYGWENINSETDIDNLHIIGCGGTDFGKMVSSFSSNADNKIVFTDGYCDFPTDRPDVLWIIINFEFPFYLDESYCPSIKNINYIFINARDILEYSLARDEHLVLEKKIR